MCPDEQLLSTYLDGELKEPWLSQVLEHLEWCPVCQQSLKDLKVIKEATKKSSLEDSKIEAAKERTLKFMDKNILNKDKKSLKRKLFDITKKKIFWPLVSAAATFCFCLIILNPASKKSNIIPYPDVTSILELDNIVPVRATDNYTTSTTLKDYSLEDIIKYLDESGYEVVLRNKRIEPLDTSRAIPEFVFFNPPLKSYNSFEFKFKINEEDTI